jgi:flagellar hook-basal body protein
MRALSIAATGMNAQQTNLEVIANNIANINTTGYKRAKAEFSDLIYQTERAAGVPNAANQQTVPEGINIGLGVKTSAVRNLHTEGDLVATGNKYDVAIIGRGFFQVEAPDGSTVYTRDGAFNTNENGELVTINGARVIPNITVPVDATEVSINRSGQVFVKRIGNEHDAHRDRPAPDRQLRQRSRPQGTGRQSVPGNDRLGLSGHRRARRSVLRLYPAGLSRRLERRSGEGNHRADLGAARL